MNRSFTRWAAFACAATALALSSAGASAQTTITLSDSNCSDFQIGGVAGARTITCIVSSPPVCSVTGPTTGTLSSPNTMTASCSPAATSWLWSSDVGSGCNASTAQSCNDTQTAAGTVNYKVTGTNASGTGPQSAAYPVVWSNTPPAKPSGCTIVQSNPSGTLPVGGGTPTLTANCTAGGAVTWLWAGGFAQGATSAIVTGSVTSTTGFTATATNSAGSTATSITVSVTTGGGGGTTCTAAQGITGATHLINVTWGVTTQTYTNQNGGFGPNDAVILAFTAPANGATLLKPGNISGAEYGDAPNARYGTLSTQPCDFPDNPLAQSSAVPIIGGGPPPSEIFCTLHTSTGGTQLCSTNVGLGWAFNPTRIGSAQLQPGVKYYINIANQPGSCFANGSCNMIFNWKWPTS